MKKNYISPNLLSRRCLSIIITFFFFIILTKTFADTKALSSSQQYGGISLGNFCEEIKKYAVDEFDQKKTCQFLPIFGGEYFFATNIFQNTPFHGGVKFHSTIPKSQRDQNIKKMVMHLLPSIRTFYESWNFDLSLGWQLTRIWGPGGEAVLNNGTSTQSYYLPEKSSYAYNFILDIGTQYQWTNVLSTGLNVQSLNLLKSDKRSFSLLILGKYYFF